MLNIMFYLIHFFIAIFSCKPREKIWKQTVPGAYLDIFSLYISSAAFNVYSDLAMLFVPLWRIWHLNMSKAQRLGISTVFLTGGL